ncbi:MULTISPECIES: RNA-binding S4 domain-containing protein [unclassified Pseudoalteromonas]|uniref:RNA-binding S4 domain-containing protein n=1 Tax=unclassified Pseudoalteromonas TaxID=194690 RepID=UPI002097A547|nr:RNA-binding S4 domain-containing protein [Pseudoalteromonas sp. XMcav2-N]MCO7190731.1 RNA-binding S4 domain-containing protein [Pseudoalteromonas sp. XMcav2-N]
MNQDYIEIELEEEPIELCNLLKVLDFAESGGQAKQLIAAGYVGVNGELCTVKRKKLYAGDTLYFNEEAFMLTLAEGAVPADRSQPPPPPAHQHSAPSATDKGKQAGKKRRNKQKNNVDSVTGRKPISFG